jgi:2-oxoglutarate/2-oxoacid ferredoxin oxidoreductase subunit alpha
LTNETGTVKFMTGNSACVHGAIDAGVRFYAGYPITPSSEIAEELSYLLPRIGGTFVQMEDEIASIGAIIGASLTGARTMTATSGPGISLMQENIGYACMTEVPCVIVNVQRGGPSTGLPTLPSQADVQQARWGTHGDHPIIALAASYVTEIYYQTIHAVNLSEKYRVPVILLFDETVCHLSERIVIPEKSSIKLIERKKPTVPPEEYLPYINDESDIPPMANFGSGYRYHVTGLSHGETGFPTNDPVVIDKLYRRINRKIERYKDEIIALDEYFIDDADMLVVSYGGTARSAKNACMTARNEGIKVGFINLKTIWPFPYNRIRELGNKCKKILVPEMNLGQIANEVDRAVKSDSEIIPVSRVDGNLHEPIEILDAIRKNVC